MLPKKEEEYMCVPPADTKCLESRIVSENNSQKGDRTNMVVYGENHTNELYVSEFID